MSLQALPFGLALTLIANVLAVFSAVWYLRGVFQGRTVPHLFSWLVWSLINCIGFAAQLSGGAGIASWVLGFSTLFTLTVTVTAIFRGEKKITRSDQISLAGALLSIALWAVTQNPLWSVILISVIDCFGFYPTFRKSWQRPFDEPLFVYFISAVRFFMAIAALEVISVTTALFPATIAVANLAFVVMAAWRRRQIALNSAA